MEGATLPRGGVVGAVFEAARLPTVEAVVGLHVWAFRLFTGRGAPTVAGLIGHVREENHNPPREGADRLRSAPTRKAGAPLHTVTLHCGSVVHGVGFLPLGDGCLRLGEWGQHSACLLYTDRTVEQPGWAQVRSGGACWRRFRFTSLAGTILIGQPLQTQCDQSDPPSLSQAATAMLAVGDQIDAPGSPA